MTKREKIFIATREKEKGNEAFATGDYVEAVTYYTRWVNTVVFFYFNDSYLWMLFLDQCTWNNLLKQIVTIRLFSKGQKYLTEYLKHWSILILILIYQKRLDSDGMQSALVSQTSSDFLNHWDSRAQK